MSELYVVAKITGKPGSQDELKAKLSRVIPTVRAEDGCIRYDLHQNLDNPAVFVFYETWRDKQALGAHAASEHMSAMLKSIKDLVAAPGEVLLFDAVDVA